MTEEAAKESGPMTNRLLAIAAVIAVAAGGAAWYFHTRYEAAKEALDRALADYNEIVKVAPEILRLLKIEQDLKKTEGSQSDPATFLGGAFTKRGFPADRFTVARERESTMPGWKETPYKVDFTRKRDDLLERARFIDTLAAIEKERPDLKTKNLRVVFDENSVTDATIVFSRFEKER